MLKTYTEIKLLNIDVTDNNLCKPEENIYIGMATKLCFYLKKITQIKKKHFKIICEWCT